MGIGTRIKELIKERRITIKQLAELTGIPVNTLYSIIKRDSERVRAETVQLLADALGVTPTYLIGYDDKIVRPEQYSQEGLNEIKSGAWAAYQDHIASTTERPILDAFRKLNIEGQQKAIERVEELTEIPKYQKEPPQD